MVLDQVEGLVMFIMLNVVIKLIFVFLADVILSASGDELYVARLIFDLTFFFLIVIILLAVFQGLISSLHFVFHSLCYI